MKEQDKTKNSAPDSPEPQRTAPRSSFGGDRRPGDAGPDLKSEVAELPEDPEDDALQLRFDAWRDAGGSMPSPRSQVPEEFESLMMVGDLLRETVTERVEAVPEAEFTALWAKIESQCQAPLRQASGSEAETPGFWAWLSKTLFRPPVYVMAGAAACALLWFNLSPFADGPTGPAAGPTGPTGSDSPAGLEQRVAQSKAQPAEEAGPKLAAHEAAAPQERSAQELSAQERSGGPSGPDLAGPAGEPNSENQIERIDFAGVSGRISQINVPRGTTTVVWIDAEEVDRTKPQKERDL